MRQPVLEAELRAAGNRGAPRLEQLGAILVMSPHGEGVAQLLAQAASSEALPRGVDERHVPLGVRHPQERRRGVGELAKARL
jgi:hypothetical protein